MKLPRPALAVATLLLLSLGARAGTTTPIPTLPTKSTGYALNVRGNCYSVTQQAGGTQKITLLRSYTQFGRMQVTPRVQTTTTNGNNIRDAILLIDHGANGGTGAMEYATNGSLYSLVVPGAYTPIDYSFVSTDAALTTLTIKPDPLRPSNSNIFKLDAGLVSEFYVIKSQKITITFLAGGRVSGKFNLRGVGFLTGAEAAITGTFGGKVSTVPLNQ